MIKRQSITHRFVRNRSGIAAVEFALVAPLFFALIFSLFETGWLMIKTALVDNAVAEVARTIYTGAAISDGTVSQDSLKAKICSQTVVLNDCLNNLTLEVTTITSLASIPQAGEVCRDSNDTVPQPAATYAPGSASEISFVRVCIATEVFTPLLGVGMALPKNSHGRFEIVSSLAFVNEPF
ncbi:MAG: TadE/TadG family type IV pilus assembly protein [Pseudomonadota bacterium]